GIARLRMNSSPSTGAYATWAHGFGVPFTSEAGLDSDKDGIPDLVEFAFNMDPAKQDTAQLSGQSDTSGLPRTSLSGSGAERRLQVEFLRRKGPSGAGLTYITEFADSPSGPWLASEQPVQVEQITGSPGWERV